MDIRRRAFCQYVARFLGGNFSKRRAGGERKREGEAGIGSRKEGRRPPATSLTGGEVEV